MNNANYSLIQRQYRSWKSHVPCALSNIQASKDLPDVSSPCTYTAWKRARFVFVEKLSYLETS
ncbi:hypothetical protein OBBRIDRAFT_798263 [Obba rivulosa]|uniref:Uncharacterized protein n=1 Tax=Obba rivulosa TaxID=1052685 RepID=A0A8E2DFZ1_9APHY|nr:hypothetical protein OBBRIDRAFT_798263 [Obba rivulosa]